MIVTIDGAAGSGKSTAARKLASRLQIAYLDTGAMYRAVALACLRRGVDLQDPEAVTAVARQATIEVHCGPSHAHVLLDGQDVTEAIRTLEVNQATPYISSMPQVREILVALQRRIGQRLGSLVTEGRDQGSVVFPDADLKFFFDAAPEKRAERRYHEMMADGIDTTYEDVLDNLRTRDGNDCCQWAPLLVPGNAIHIDTTRYTIEQVVQLLMDHVEALRRQGH